MVVAMSSPGSEKLLFDALLRNDIPRLIEISRTIVLAETERVARLGDWPEWIDAIDTLASRIPSPDGRQPGFDAGIACALNLIPADKQRLSAKLHADFTADAIGQVRREMSAVQPDANSESVWWLAACNVCVEQGVSAETFADQIRTFQRLMSAPLARVDAAQREYADMRASFDTARGYPFGTRDGCILGAYLAGYLVGVEYVPSSGEYYIGTLLPDLGLDSFHWSCDLKRHTNCRSGPVEGSRQYVRCINIDEFSDAMERVRHHFESIGKAVLSKQAPCSGVTRT